jgi:hypothetical protein
VDSDRNVVTMTHSSDRLPALGSYTGTGISFNNFLGHFNPLPGHPIPSSRKSAAAAGSCIVFKRSAIHRDWRAGEVNHPRARSSSRDQFGMDMRTA